MFDNELNSPVILSYMHGKKYLAIFTVSFIIIYGLVKIPSISRAASDSDQIPSDLSLDLNLAQQNPARAQRQIIQSQTSQAEIVTDKGEQAVVVVKDELPPEVKLQSAKDALNPEQTTSEQVVQNGEEKNGQNNNGDFNNIVQPSGSNSPTSKDVIPGTDILEPDDNTAPQNPPNSSSPQTTSGDQTNSTSTPSGSSTTSSSNSDTQQPADIANTIPPENGVAPSSAPPQGSSTENSAPKEESHPSSNSESTPNQPSSGNNDSGSSGNSGSESTGGDSSAVQGVSTASNIPLWQQLLSRIIGILK